MPRSARWRDLSKLTKSGLSLPQYRLTIANAELVLTGITQPNSYSQPPYWIIRCAACRMPETRLSIPAGKLNDVNAVQTAALQALQKHLTDQQSVAAIMLEALDGLGVTQPKSKAKAPVQPEPTPFRA